MADYKLTVHKDTEHEKDNEGVETKLQATIVVSFDNPEYEAPREEETTFTDDDGKEQTKTVTIESDQPEKLEFTQEIFVPVGEKEQKEVAQSYADDYEKGFLAQEQ